MSLLNEIKSMTEEQLLKIYEEYCILKNKEKIQKDKDKKKSIKYFKSDKGKAKLKEVQKRYYEKNREKILKKYHEKKLLKK